MGTGRYPVAWAPPAALASPELDLTGHPISESRMHGADSLSRPFAVVLSCDGAPESDLNLVRSLGRGGAYVVVVSEYPDPPSARSTHCAEHIVVRDFTLHPGRLVEALASLRRRLELKPVLFPSADPDLAIVSTCGSELDEIAHSPVFEPGLTKKLMDKREFAALAETHRLPTPRTYAPRTMSDIDAIAEQAAFPLIAKPVHPAAWNTPDVIGRLGKLKALPLPDVQAMRTAIRDLGSAVEATLLQELIPGGDDEHYEVQTYIGRAGREMGTFAGRKWRINPPHAGSGCYVEGVHLPELEAATVNSLRDIGYRGLANVDYKRNARTGEFKMLEINPRISQWSILGTVSGVNLAWLAYRDCCGLEPEVPMTRRNGVHYVNERTDPKAFRVYRREGLWSSSAYLHSLLSRDLVWQFFQRGDLAPGFSLLRSALRDRMRHRG